MKKLFLTGGTSLLGAALLAKIPPGWQVILAEHKNRNVFPARKKLTPISFEITSLSQVKTAIKGYQPHLVLHAAALSNVDYCQKHQKEAWQVNVTGTQNIIKACEASHLPLIFISSNAVFDGTKDFYLEEDEPRPVNFYGLTKYEAEKKIKQSSLSWLIVRLMTMYGWPPPGARPNPVTWALEKLKKGKKLRMVNDVYLNPLYNLDAARVLWAMIKKGQRRKIYHVAGREIVNRYQWTITIAEVFGLDQSLISPVPRSFFAGKIAPRPAKTIYSIKKIKQELGIFPRGVKAGLRAMKKEKPAVPYLFHPRGGNRWKYQRVLK